MHHRLQKGKHNKSEIYFKFSNSGFRFRFRCFPFPTKRNTAVCPSYCSVCHTRDISTKHFITLKYAVGTYLTGNTFSPVHQGKNTAGYLPAPCSQHV